MIALVGDCTVFHLWLSDFMCDRCYYNTSSNASRKFFIYARIYDKRGMILSSGYNSYTRTDPLFKQFAEKSRYPYKEFIHAEFSALKKLRYNDFKRVYGIRIYRFTSNGKPALAKPCPVCQNLLDFYEFKEVEYTTEDDSLDMTYGEYQELKRNAVGWIR